MAVNSQKDYSAGDFKQAISALLPDGDYWEYEAGSTLDYLLSGMGNDFKTTHDEIKIPILNDIDKTKQNWRLVDYQAMLNNVSVIGKVTDLITTPNLIYIELNQNSASGKLMQSLENYRLPHTDFSWKINYTMQLFAFATNQSLQINRIMMRSI